MNQITEKDINDIIKRAQKTGRNRELKFSKLFNLLKANPADVMVYNLIIEMLKEAEMNDLVDPDPFRATNPISNLLPGTIGLGKVPPKGVPYLIYPEMLTTHMLICGRTGGGKSNLIFLILLQLLEMKND
ncbi:MAG: DUF87 domain-containing protein [candidate division Zixibacteria bacterium]|nr:DUF87 domain-containing protein [candidate division Zixibacteria bacterium]